jgi:hypothetical protein
MVSFVEYRHTVGVEKTDLVGMRGPHGRTSPARVPEPFVRALEPDPHRLIRAGS